jgi:hypothetical protein
MNGYADRVAEEQKLRQEHPFSSYLYDEAVKNNDTSVKAFPENAGKYGKGTAKPVDTSAQAMILNANADQFPGGKVFKGGTNYNETRIFPYIAGDKKTGEIKPSSQDEEEIVDITENLEEIKEFEFDEETLDEKNKDDITDYILNDIMENSNPNINDTLGIVTNKLDNKTPQLKNTDTTIAIDSHVLDNDINNDLTEITLDIEELLPESINTLEIPVMKLKKPNEVYYDLFNKAKIKAKEAKKIAIQSYLEAKKIKEAYLLEDVDLSEEDENDENDEDF